MFFVVKVVLVLNLQATLSPFIASFTGLFIQWKNTTTFFAKYFNLQLFQLHFYTKIVISIQDIYYNNY